MAKSELRSTRWCSCPGNSQIGQLGRQVVAAIVDQPARLARAPPGYLEVRRGCGPGLHFRPFGRIEEERAPCRSAGGHGQGVRASQSRMISRRSPPRSSALRGHPRSAPGGGPCDFGGTTWAGQRRQFTDDGWTTVPGLFTARELLAMRAEIDALSGPGLFPQPHRRGRCRPRRGQRESADLPAVAAQPSVPRPALPSTRGRDRRRAHRTSAGVHPRPGVRKAAPGDGAATDWHQDNAYFGGSDATRGTPNGFSSTTPRSRTAHHGM